MLLMEKSEPALVPQWLRSNVGITNIGSSPNHTASSTPRADTSSSLNRSRSRSKSAADGDSPRSFSLERSSSTSRHGSNANGFSKHPYSSFTRSHRDKDKWILDPCEPVCGRMERDMLKRSRSMVSGKHSESFQRRSCNGSTHVNGNGNGGKPRESIIRKVSFEKEFPSLGSEEKLDDGRVPSPILSPILSIPVGGPSMGGWTSVLAEVPPSVHHVSSSPSSASSPSSSSVTPNMAEALAQPSSRARQSQLPQVSVQTQRLEELAIRQSRQLIPMTPSMSKASKTMSMKGGQARGGRFMVLKPVRESDGSLMRETANGQLGSSSCGLGSRGFPQLQSRTDFFNLMRKKKSSVCDTAAASATPAATAATQGSSVSKVEGESESPPAEKEEKAEGAPSPSLGLEEEEARFLRSLGWEEDAEDNGGLTEEEISSFFAEYVKMKPTLKLRSGVQPKISMLCEYHAGENAGAEA